MKNCRYFIIFFILFTSVAALAQAPFPKKCYLRLQGKIGKDYLVDMNLVKIDDSIYGEFSYSNENNAPELVFPKFSVMTFSGKSDAKGNFILGNPYEKIFSFNGKFSGAQAISGTFESAGGKFRQPFNLREEYSGGAVPLNVYFQNGKNSLTNKPGSPSAYIALCLLLPGESGNQVFSESLKKIMLTKFTGKMVRNTNPDQVLGGMRQSYFENYIATNESIYKPGMGQSFSWESLRYTHILMNNHNLLTFYVDIYGFTGGAHGMEVRDHTVVNLRNGKIVGLKDIFRTGYNEKLTSILTAKARKQFQIEDDKSLKDAGFFVDEIKPGDNFYVTDGGIGFFYNHYEIAPYSFGSEDFFISYEELSHLIDRNGVLKDIFR